MSTSPTFAVSRLPSSVTIPAIRFPPIVNSAVVALMLDIRAFAPVCAWVIYPPIFPEIIVLPVNWIVTFEFVVPSYQVKYVCSVLGLVYGLRT